MLVFEELICLILHLNMKQEALEHLEEIFMNILISNTCELAHLKEPVNSKLKK